MDYYTNLDTLTERVLKAAKPLRRVRHPSLFIHFNTELWYLDIWQMCANEGCCVLFGGSVLYGS